VVASIILSPVRLRHVLLVVVFLVAHGEAHGQTHPTLTGTARTYTVERWTTERGLPNQALSALTIGRDGYLWIGTFIGVFRFDGVRFTPTLAGLPTANIRTLLQASDGSVWVGMVGAGLAQYRNGALTLYSAKDLGSDDVRSLAEDKSGRVWVGLEDGAAIVHAGVVTRVGRGLAGRVPSLDPHPGDGMWLSAPGRVCAAAGGRLRCSTPADDGGRSLGGEVVENVVTEGVLAYGAGLLWVGGRQGLFSMRDDFTPAPPCARGCLRGRAVTALLRTARGPIVAGMADGAIAVVSSDATELYTAADGLAAGPVVSLREDREGSIWSAVYNGGLERLRPKRLRMFSTDDGLPVKVAGSIVQDRDGVIWAASQCGPVSEFRDDRFLPRFEAETAGMCPLALWAASDGSLWIGTDQGLLRRRGEQTVRYDGRSGLSDPHVRALFEDRDGVLWVGTLYGKLHTIHDGVLSRGFGEEDGVAEGQIESFAQDPDGRIWIGSNGHGLSVFEDGKFRRLGPGESPRERGITGLFVDSRGDLWIATDRGGVYRRRNGRLEQFGTAQGIGDAFVGLILEDRSGVIWLSTARGISRLQRDRLDAVAEGRAAHLDAANLDRADGMLNPEVSGGGFDPTGLQDRAGRLWFSTIDGIVRIDPATFPLNTLPPPVVVESAAISGRPAGELGGGLMIEAGGPPLEVNYTGLSLYAPEKMRFRFRLHGFDAGWIDAGPRRTAYYPHLLAGSYRFEVQAANNDGVWSTTPAFLAITVAPFWWERPAVRATALLLLLLATGLSVRAVSIRRANARLKELEREQALERERRRIAQDLHDDIGARLTQLALMADRRGDRIPELSAAARDAIQAMDELVWTVNASNDTVDAVITYGVAYADEYLRPAGVRLRVQTPAASIATPIGADMRRHLFLCLKEALNNVVKHSGATEVRLTFEVRDRGIELEIRDNGRGFDPAGVAATGNGLAGFRSRAAAMAGECEVSSSPGEGTSVRIRLPLDARPS
jgi:signal transduction histidine kinase/ligand-binding sensor domain-containing protein